MIRTSAVCSIAMLVLALTLSVLSSRGQTKLVDAQSSLTDNLVELSENIRAIKEGGKCL